MEKAPNRVRALRELIKRSESRDISIVQDDANVAIPRCLAALTRSDRAIVFLDPYGMQLEWTTLCRVAESQVADVWYLFPISAVYRQASKDAAALDEDKTAALTRILGTPDWRSDFYDPRPQLGLFGQGSDVRTADVSDMLNWWMRRMETIFPAVANPKVLRQVTESGKEGAPLFALFFAVSNPSPRARELALKIANGILKA